MRRIRNGGRGRGGGDIRGVRYNTNNNRLRRPAFHCGWIEMPSSSSLYNNDNDIDNGNENNITLRMKGV